MIGIIVPRLILPKEMAYPLAGWRIDEPDLWQIGIP